MVPTPLPQLDAVDGVRGREGPTSRAGSTPAPAAIEPEPPTGRRPRGNRASQTRVSTPSEADRRSGCITRAKVGRPAARPGVSAQPGCTTWKSTPEEP